MAIFASGRMRIGCTLLMVILLAGTVGFMLIEGWSLFQALYTTTLVVSTLGFSDLRPLDARGQLLTIGLIAGGVGTLYYLVGVFAQAVIENQLDWGKRHMMDQQVARLKNHFIVCGFGRVGQHTCQQLALENHSFVVIDLNSTRLEAVQAAGYLYIAGDASDDEVLKRAGIERARALLTAVQSDAGNVYITLSARALNPKLFIVARAATDEAEHKLKIAGANRVISPYILGGRGMASMALRPAVMDFIDVLVHSDDLAMWLEELPIGADSPFNGLSLDEIQLHERIGITILAVRRADGHMLVNPPSTYALNQDDTLIVLGRRSDIERIEEERSEI